MDGEDVRIRARAQNSRAQGGGCFVVLRQEMFTVQGIVWKGETVSKKMVNFTKSINKESIIEIVGKAVKAPVAIESCTQSTIEIQISEVWNVHSAEPKLPFQLEDAGRRVEDQVAEFKEDEKEEENEETPTPDPTEEDGKKQKVEIKVNQKTRLDNRIIDLRLPASKAIMKVHSSVGLLFREFCESLDFTEIHSPKLLAGSSEGGAEIFRLKYFGKDSCLA